MKNLEFIKREPLNEIKHMFGLTCNPKCSADVQAVAERKKHITGTLRNLVFLPLRFLKSVFHFVHREWALAELQNRKLRALKDEMYRNYFPGSHIK